MKKPFFRIEWVDEYIKHLDFKGAVEAWSGLARTAGWAPSAIRSVYVDAMRHVSGPEGISSHHVEQFCKTLMKNSRNKE